MSLKIKTGVELAEEFLNYCKENPDQRFWQALLNWSRVPFIFWSSRPIFKAKEKETQLQDPYNVTGDWRLSENAPERK